MICVVRVAVSGTAEPPGHQAHHWYLPPTIPTVLYQTYQAYHYFLAVCIRWKYVLTQLPTQRPSNHRWTYGRSTDAHEHEIPSQIKVFVNFVQSFILPNKQTRRQTLERDWLWIVKTILHRESNIIWWWGLFHKFLILMKLNFKMDLVILFSTIFSLFLGSW
jgi:hypothetical protein